MESGRVSKEYIEKEAALELSKYLDHEHGNKHFIWGVETYAEYLQGLSSVNVEPAAEGKWIRPTSKGGFYCTSCGGPAPLFKDDYNRVYFCSTNFCPHCGAKMRV